MFPWKVYVKLFTHALKEHIVFWLRRVKILFCFRYPWHSKLNLYFISLSLDLIFDTKYLNADFLTLLFKFFLKHIILVMMSEISFLTELYQSLLRGIHLRPWKCANQIIKEKVNFYNMKLESSRSCFFLNTCLHFVKNFLMTIFLFLSIILRFLSVKL